MSDTSFGMSFQLCSQGLSNSFKQKFAQVLAQSALMKWLTDVADTIKQVEDIRSLINNFIKDFICLKINHM